MKLPSLAAALLYAALPLCANAALAQGLDADTRARITELREGDMRKLIVHASPAPQVERGFTDAQGNPVTLADSAGMVRVVNFWATWCAPCREEMPSLDNLQTLLSGPDFAVLTIATGPHEIDEIERFFTEIGVQGLPILLDPRMQFAGAYGAMGLPVTLILDREGYEVARLSGGAHWDSDSALDILRAVIAAQ